MKLCIKKELINLIMVYLYSIRNTYNRRICGRTTKKSILPLINDASCITDNYYKNDQCILEFMNQTAPLVYLEDDTLKIPHTCW